MEDVANVPIEIPGTGEVIALRDIANVRRGYVDPPESPFYYNGDQAVLIGSVQEVSEQVANHWVDGMKSTVQINGCDQGFEGTGGNRGFAATTGLLLSFAQTDHLSQVDDLCHLIQGSLIHQ